ncbi:MAG: MBL fold metallo-hydrolase [Alphaproteobacteria bacterium]|nr:MBL fold metallo-hydrolase [Alphaproteobacteria bacterium]
MTARRWARRRPHSAAAALFCALGTLCLLALSVAPALANCQPVARAPGVEAGVIRAGFAPPVSGTVSSLERYLHRAQGLPTAPPPEGEVEVTYLGHSSFLIRTPKGASAITDYNGYIRSALPPDIVTMNHAHETHYTDIIEPGVKHVLRGWTTAEGGYPRHNVLYRDLRVRNVATNIRGISGGTEFAGNSIFIFEIGDLCLAHLGHLHHQLTESHLGRIGAIDILFVAIDDNSTMPQAEYAEVIRALKPRVVIPMHYFDEGLLNQFYNLLAPQGYVARPHSSQTIRFAKRRLPKRAVILLPGGGF